MAFITVDDSNRSTAVEILAEAFSDDPVMNWSCNNPASLVPFFELTLAPFIPHGLTYLDPQLRGAAAWLAPDEVLKWPFNLTNVLKMLKNSGIRGAYRMAVSGAATEKHHPKTPHYYLFAIGATPQARGQGVGSALISHLLRRCDAESMPAYLENSKAQNLPFYRGHGFEVIKEIRFAASAPPVWLMWREPH
ncbi:MAG: GNAT family N-acetyltransferase [Gammaproteobacteria bacterium]|jgi:ribosomal protein S18 acetylase RimI-like enzyme|nr:GNAT family N-acetyltransferase [Gammaproteobacteria bacterium]